MPMIEQRMTVGQYLRSQREGKELSIESISKRSRINPDFLRALEEDAFQVLPAEAYVLGFLRNYANFLKTDPDEVLDLYRKQVQPAKDRAREKAVKPSPLKSVTGHLFDFLTTIAGGAPAYSVSKSVLPPKH